MNVSFTYKLVYSSIIIKNIKNSNIYKQKHLLFKSIDHILED